VDVVTVCQDEKVGKLALELEEEGVYGEAIEERPEAAPLTRTNRIKDGSKPHSFLKENNVAR
jgi:hypothetical protein